MKYCPNCGTQVPENSKFCPSCGNSVDVNGNVETNSYVQPTYESNNQYTQTNYENQNQFNNYNNSNTPINNNLDQNNNGYNGEIYNNQKPASNNNVIIIIIAIVVFVGIAFGIFTLLNGSDNSSKKPSNKNTTEQTLCDTIDPYIKDYESNNLSYEQLLSQLENSCKTVSQNSICQRVQTMIGNNKNLDLELEDCSKWNDQDGKVFKDLCLSNNAAKETMRNRLPETQKAEVSIIKMDCQIASEE